MQPRTPSISFFVYSKDNLRSRCRATAKGIHARDVTAATEAIYQAIWAEAYAQKLLLGDDWSPALDALQDDGRWATLIESLT